MRPSILLVLSVLVLSQGCNLSDGSIDTPQTTIRHEELSKKDQQQVNSTGYDEWRVRGFTNVSLRLDLPVGVRAEEVFDGKIWILSMGFHHVSPPPSVLDDATVFVHVYINRTSFDALAEKLASIQRSNLYKESTEQENKYWFWRYAFHPVTIRWDEKGNHTYYRRDVKLDNNEILHAYAEVLNVGPQESQDADHAAVKRILDSIMPLNEGR